MSQMLVKIDGREAILPGYTPTRASHFEGTRDLDQAGAGEELEAALESDLVGSGWKKIRVISRVFDIPQENWERFEKKFGQMAKKAAKVGASAPTWRELGTYRVDLRSADEKKEGLDPYYRLYHQVVVEGEGPKYEGWKFIGTIESATEALGKGMYLLQMVPGEEIPPKYKKRDEVDPLWCDHCRARRHRTATFLVENEDSGEIVQCGRQCIRDFLGHPSPQAVASYLEWLSSGLEELEEEREGGGYGGEWSFDILDFLAKCRTVMRKDGWVSRSAAREIGASSTASVVLWLLSPSFSAQERRLKQEYLDFQEPEDRAYAKAALEWAPTLWEGKDPDELSGYIFNLQAALSTNLVTAKTAGLVASLVRVYQREEEKEAERKVREAERKAREAERSEEAAVSRWLGSVGSKIGPLKVTILQVRPIESEWGSKNLIKMRTDDGAHITWWYSGRGLYAPGERYMLNSASVAKHGDYQGVKETTVKRANMTPLFRAFVKLTQKQGDLVAERVGPWDHVYDYDQREKGEEYDLPWITDDHKLLVLPGAGIHYADALVEWLGTQGKLGAAVIKRIEDAWDERELGRLAA